MTDPKRETSAIEQTKQTSAPTKGSGVQIGAAEFEIVKALATELKSEPSLVLNFLIRLAAQILGRKV